MRSHSHSYILTHTYSYIVIVIHIYSYVHNLTILHWVPRVHRIPMSYFSLHVPYPHLRTKWCQVPWLFDRWFLYVYAYVCVYTCMNEYSHECMYVCMHVRISAPAIWLMVPGSLSIRCPGPYPSSFRVRRSSQVLCIPYQCKHVWMHNQSYAYNIECK